MQFTGKLTPGRAAQPLNLNFRVPDPLVWKGPGLESTSARNTPPEVGGPETPLVRGLEARSKCRA
jgi:hypothetical protein